VATLPSSAIAAAHSSNACKIIMSVIHMSVMCLGVQLYCWNK